MTGKLRNLILIGMPACGKSTVGVLLAKYLGYDFIDTDLLIQRREVMRLENLIRTRGRDVFLGIEEEICSDLQAERTVIATGGSVVYHDGAMRHLKSMGPVIYLQVDLDVLEKRLTDAVERGVVFQEGQTLRDLYEERTALYETYADVTVPEGTGTLDDTVAAVKRAIAEC